MIHRYTDLTLPISTSLMCIMTLWQFRFLYDIVGCQLCLHTSLSFVCMDFSADGWAHNLLLQNRNELYTSQVTHMTKDVTTVTLLLKRSRWRFCRCHYYQGRSRWWIFCIFQKEISMTLTIRLVLDIKLPTERKILQGWCALWSLKTVNRKRTQ